jgi:hypothetical protein
VKPQCGEYGVALIELILLKLQKLVFNLVPIGRSISGIAGKIRGQTELWSPGLSGCTGAQSPVFPEVRGL